MKEKVELLAPAGDLEKLKMAFLYGADACYIGGELYSLRANANNFSLEVINNACEYAHSIGKKIYVTVNIIFHNEELKDIDNYLSDLDKAKVDAIILSDPFLIDYINRNHKNLKIHVSTQASTTNKEAVNFWLGKGVERIVLARELSKKEIKEIIDETGASIEVFLHGAMCICYSGRCVLSNYFTNRDANRGGCAQVCRFAFDLDKKRKTPFSIATKDLNLSNYISDLIEIGVDSLKIEGRMRSSYYIATVINSYRNLIDSYYEGNLSSEILRKEQKKLSRVANRESSSQYINSKANGKDQYYMGRQEVSNQDFLGLVIDYDESNKIITLEQRNYFKPNDKVNFFGPNGINYDIVIDKIYDEDMNELDCARHPKQIIKIMFNKVIPTNSIMRIQF
jgi:putative protease